MQYYVYVLARPDGRAFYVGKGSGKRIFTHDGEARSGHDCPKCDVIRAIWAAGGKVQRYTVYTTDDENDAYAYEQTMIELLGSSLANTSAGRNATWTPALRAKLEAIFAQPEYRKKLRNNARRLWRDPAYRARVTQAIASAHRDPAFRQAMSEIKRQHWQDDGYREKVIATRNTPEYRAQQREHLATQTAADPAFYEKSLAARRTPESRAKHAKAMSEANRRKWADPEYRARMTRIRQEQGEKKRAENAARRAAESLESIG